MGACELEVVITTANSHAPASLTGGSGYAEALAYRARQRQRRRQALDKIFDESQAAGLYDLPDSAYLDALHEIRKTR